MKLIMQTTSTHIRPTTTNLQKSRPLTRPVSRQRKLGLAGAGCSTICSVIKHQFKAPKHQRPTLELEGPDNLTRSILDTGLSGVSEDVLAGRAVAVRRDDKYVRG